MNLDQLPAQIKDIPSRQTLRNANITPENLEFNIRSLVVKLKNGETSLDEIEKLLAHLPKDFRNQMIVEIKERYLEIV